MSHYLSDYGKQRPADKKQQKLEITHNQRFAPAVLMLVHSNGVRTRKRHRTARSPTPPNSEERVIEASSMRMSEMCRDLKQGRVSQRYRDLQQMDIKRKEQLQRERQEGSNGDATATVTTTTATEVASPSTEQLAPSDSSTKRPTGKASKPKDRIDEIGRAMDMASVEQSAATEGVPQTRVVGSRIVVDTGSLRVDRSRQGVVLGRGASGAVEYVEENELTRTVNSASHSNRLKSDRWDRDSTDKFFQLISQFGTDFGLISKMFAGRNRRQIKSKFNLEERRNPQLIEASLKRKIPIGK